MVLVLATCKTVIIYPVMTTNLPEHKLANCADTPKKLEFILQCANYVTTVVKGFSCFNTLTHPVLETQ